MGSDLPDWVLANETDARHMAWLMEELNDHHYAGQESVPSSGSSPL